MECGILTHVSVQDSGNSSEAICLLLGHEGLRLGITQLHPSYRQL